MAEVLKRWNETEWVPVATINRVEVSGGIMEPIITRVYNVGLSTTESYVEFNKPLTMASINEALDAFIITYNLNDTQQGYSAISAIEVIDGYTVKITHQDLELIDDSKLTVGYNDERGNLIGTNGYSAFGCFKTNTMAYPFIGIRLAETMSFLNLVLNPIISDVLSPITVGTPGEDESFNESIILTNLIVDTITLDDTNFTTILE